MVAKETVIIRHGNPDGTDRKVETSGSSNTVIKPALGIGFRFNRSVSVDLILSSFGAKNVLGTETSGTIMEFSLGLHL
jgi:hypothetical protein